MTDWSDYAREVQAAADSAGRRADTEMKSLKCRIQELEKACKEWADISQSNYQRAKAAEAKLAEAEDETREMLHTLDAWFDRRELAHAAIDQAVVDAASGYLRTSRSGGMPSEESDLVLGVIQDMARLSVFADLFARTTLAELKGQDNGQTPNAG
jgi:hypothetical protein